MFGTNLLQSIVRSDLYILIAAILTALLFILCLWLARKNTGRTVKWRIRDNVDFSLDINKELTVFYSLFTTMISLFPLLGMFGTVTALLGLDLSAGDLDGVKGNFFDALTSTAWGIIFSVVYKVLHALFADFIEDQIRDSRQVSSGGDSVPERSGESADEDASTRDGK